MPSEAKVEAAVATEDGNDRRKRSEMNTSTDIQERLDRLERSNRRLKVGFLAGLVFAAVVVTTGAVSTTPKVLEAEKIVLKDAAGNERGELFANENAWGLVLFNKNSTKAASLLVGETLNGVVLFDQNGNLRQTITTNLDKSEWDMFHPGSDSAQFEAIATGEGTALTVRDRANKPRVEIGTSTKGGSLVSASDSNGRIRAMMSGGEVGFISYSKDGTLDWSPGWDKFSPEEKEKIKALLPKMPD
jgi:hypothetical protein